MQLELSHERNAFESFLEYHNGIFYLEKYKAKSSFENVIGIKFWKKNIFLK